MVMRKMVISLLVGLMLIGCTKKGPIAPSQSVWVILPQQLELVAVDPDQHKVMAQVKLDQTAIDYAQAPNGKIYIPLHGKPGDRKTVIQVLDPSSGDTKNVKVPMSGDLITITPNGTAFVRTGTVTDKGSVVLVLDTGSDRVLRTITLPGLVHRMVNFSANQVMIPATNPRGYGGNVYLVDDTDAIPRPLFPFDLMPFAPAQVIIGTDHRMGYFMYNGIPVQSTERRAELSKHVSAELLEPHIDVWDLQTLKLLRRIQLHLPSAQNMTLASDGNLYVGHLDLTSANPVHEISIVDPESGAVRELETIPNPFSVAAKGEYLYVASRSEPLMEIIHIPDLRKVGRVTFQGPPAIPPSLQ
jgi:hypothetical protein